MLNLGNNFNKTKNISGHRISLAFVIEYASSKWIISFVVRFFSSLTTNGLFAASGWRMMCRKKSHKLLIDTMSREFSIPAKGSGMRLLMSVINVFKLPLHSGPHTSGGLTIVKAVELFFNKSLMAISLCNLE